MSLYYFFARLKTLVLSFFSMLFVFLIFSALLPASLIAAINCTITADPKTTVSKDIRGFGWAIPITDGPSGGPTTEAQDTTFRQYYSNGPGSFQRVCISNMMVEPFNDNDDSWNADLSSGFIFTPGWASRPEVSNINVSPYLANAGYVYTSPNMLTRWSGGYTDYDYMVKSLTALEKVMQWCEDNDMDVMLDTMHIGRWQSSWYYRYCWLAETQYGETRNQYPKYSDDNGAYANASGSCWNDYPYNLEELGENVAAIVYYLKVVKGFKCLKWVSPMNEPNCTWGSPTITSKGWKLAALDMYAALDRHLKNFNGINLKAAPYNVGVISNWCYTYSAPDLSYMLTTSTGPGGPKGDLSLDGIGIGGGGLWKTIFDYSADESAQTMEDYIADIRASSLTCKSDDQDSVIEEIYCPESYGQDNTQQYNITQAVFAEVEQAVRLMNEGVKGYVSWSHREAWYPLLSSPKQKLYGMGFLSKYVKKHSDVLKTGISGTYSDNSSVSGWTNVPGQRSAQRVWPALFRSTAGYYSLAIVNDSGDTSGAKVALNVPSVSMLNFTMDCIYDADPANSSDFAGITPSSAGTRVLASPSLGQYTLGYASGSTVVEALLRPVSVTIFHSTCSSPLNPPSSPGYANLTATTVRATWGANENGWGTFYEIEISTYENHSFSISCTTSNLSYDFTGLTPATTYFFRVRAWALPTVSSWTSLGSTVTLKLTGKYKLNPKVDNVEKEVAIENAASIKKYSFHIPAGALSSDETVNFVGDPSPPRPSAGLELVGGALDIQLDSGRNLFGRPVSFSLGLDRDNLTGALKNRNASLVKAAYFSGSKWTVIPDSSLTEETLTFTVDHLTKFAPVIQAPSANMSGLIAYPNPFHPGYGRITFEGLTADATIKIYDLPGSQVRTIRPGTSENTGNNGSATWDGRNEDGDFVGMGLYHYRVSDPAGNSFSGKIGIKR